ncbi:MAG: hypothetical protein NDJ92_01440 [Thermoanaerobaculia bacterium]|nr:hypothetical protein [Thermoanaerobaculia bacterium]
MRTRSKTLLVAMALLSLPLAACGSSAQLAYDQGERSPDEPALGSVTLASRKAGDVTFSPGRCTAGDNELFLGGDFIDEQAGMILRFVIDALHGPAVRAFSMKEPNDRTVVFRRSECRTFQFKIERTGLTVNDVDEYRISLKLDCATGEGTLQANVASDSCL